MAPARSSDPAMSRVDLGFRPETYWPGEPPSASLQQRVDTAIASTAPGFFFAGSDLPGEVPGEVEIARVIIESVLGDVVSVRARPVASGRIAYRVVDEHEERYSWEPRTSARPLTLKQLVRSMDAAEVRGGNGYAAGLVWNQVDYDFTIWRDARTYADYVRAVRVYSGFYPDLDAYYQRQILSYLAARDAREAAK